MLGRCIAWGIAAIAVATIVVPSASARTFEVNRLGDPVPDGCTRQECTLREAVIAANERSGPDAIVLRSGREYSIQQAGSGEDLGALGDLDVSDPVKIEADGRRRATIQANGLDRALDFFARGTVTRLAITGGVLPVGERGAAISGEAPVRVLRSKITGNRADAGFGNAAGGLYLLDGGAIKRSVIADNDASGNAGGAWVSGNPGAPFVVDRSRFVRNR